MLTSSIRRLRERWRVRRDRIRRLNAARYAGHPDSRIEPIIHAHHRDVNEHGDR